MTKSLKVGYTSRKTSKLNRNYTFYPKIDIHGQWLKELGFTVGDVVRIIASDNYIQIVKETTPEMKGGEVC